VTLAAGARRKYPHACAAKTISVLLWSKSQFSCCGQWRIRLLLFLHQWWCTKVQKRISNLV